VILAKSVARGATGVMDFGNRLHTSELQGIKGRISSLDTLAQKRRTYLSV